MKSKASASIDLLRLLMGYATTQGLSSENLLAEAGLDGELLKDREVRIPFEQYHSLWLSAVKISGDLEFGLHFGEAAKHFPQGHILGAMMMNSPTVGEALERFFRFHDLMSDAVSPSLERTGTKARITLEQIAPTLKLDRHYNEANLSTILTFIRNIGARGDCPVEVCFNHKAPCNTAEHQRIFACPIKFEQPGNQLQLPIEVLNRRIQHADHELLIVVERMAAQRLERSIVTSGWSHKAERAILRMILDGRKPSAEEVAGDLAVSIRYLQGQLKDEKTTYQQVLDAVRKELAMDYLGQGDVSLCEVAFLLGFSEQSTFNHAFKRWTGSTPGKYQRQ